MGLDLLDTPVRVTWDFPQGEKNRTEPHLTEIAGCIADAGVFFLTLQGQPLCHAAFEEALEQLVGRCQLLVNCHGQPAEMKRLAQLSLPPCQLLLDVGRFVEGPSSLDSERLHLLLGELRNFGHEPVLSLTPLRGNLHNIPDLLRFCSEHQVAKIKLPNAHIGDSFHQYSTADLPRWQDLDQFRKLWAEFFRQPEVLPSMEIHDLFLWEIMTPDQQQNRSEYGGCQAGNSLAHVDCFGVVHPCAAWPQPLGTLPGQSLQQIWDGRERLAIRQKIATTPEGCMGCRDLALCFGGCRGLSTHLNRDAGERDLMCSGRR